MRRALRIDLGVSLALLGVLAAALTLMEVGRAGHAGDLERLEAQRHRASKLHADLQNVFLEPVHITPEGIGGVRAELRERRSEIYHELADVESVSLATERPLAGAFRNADEAYFGSAFKLLDGVQRRAPQGDLSALAGELESARANMMDSLARWRASLSARDDQLRQARHVSDRMATVVPFLIIGAVVATRFVLHRGFVQPLVDRLATEGEEARAIARRSERLRQMMSAIAYHSPAAIWGAGPDLCVSVWSRGAARLFGFDEEEVLGRPVLDLIASSQAGEIEARLRELGQRGGSLEIETVCRAKDRRLVPVLLGVSPFHSAAGELEGFACVVQDVTPRKTLEAAHDLSLELASHLDPTAVSRRLLDFILQTTQCDQAVLLEYDDRASTFSVIGAVGYGQERLPEWPTCPAAEDLVGRRILTGKIGVLEVTAADLEVSPALKVLVEAPPPAASVVLVPLVQPGPKILGGCVVVSKTRREWDARDISALELSSAYGAIALHNARLYEAQSQSLDRMRELDELKTTFLASVSHEIKTPLSVIRGSASHLLSSGEGPLSDAQRRFLGIILRNSEILSGFISNLLDLSRIEAGRFQLQLSACSAREVLDEVLEALGSRAREKGIQLVRAADVPDRESSRIRADRDRLRQVLVNLCSNAIRFTPEGGRVDVDLRAGRDGVEIGFADTGIGIPEDDQPRIFEKFFQAGNVSGSLRKDGTGLGLAISKAIVEAHGGSIGFVSEPGRGSRFSVFFKR
ncbi:MAG: PAS domain S-box protein [Nitrospirae bacterium]|nr:PAS domain S-box protein [Nitrospirota bacterium]